MENFTDEATELLQLKDKTESNIRAVIRQYFKKTVNADISSEWRTDTGSIDLYLKNRRIIIETKDPKRLDKGPEFHGTGGNAEETAIEQIDKYVYAERKQEKLVYEEKIQNLPWIGVITDGSKWWIYEYPPIGQGNLRTPDPAWQGTLLTKTNIDSLTKIFDRKIGRDWAPSDPTSLFDDHLESLKVLYEKEEGKPSLETMKELWLRQLVASGNAPEKHDETELFILHTLLISVSSLITNSIMNKDEPRLGFAAWVVNSDWLKAIKNTIDTYNWRQGDCDVLRALYMGLVDVKHRKIYGEFYTPDWLAELLCLEVLDDKWIQTCIDDHYLGKHSGVLDPACGSGTFLFHAVKRIMNSDPVKNASISQEELSEMLVKLVNGIDIHPVAVEMSRANLLRALPTIPSGGLRIWQGDSLQTDRKDSKQLTLSEEDENSIAIYSRKNRSILLPKSFLSRSNIINDVERLVESANNKKPFPAGLDAGLDNNDSEMLKNTHKMLTKICLDEGNSIWAWYILNRVGPFILSKEKVSRIVANPPWVRISNIQDAKRKEEILNAAGQEKFTKKGKKKKKKKYGAGIWVGGKNATGFDIASLFVVKCKSLYLLKIRQVRLGTSTSSSTWQ